LLMGYYRDHFGFRNTLIRALAIGRYHGGLGMDAHAPVIFGKDNWLFFPSSLVGDWLADRSLSPFSESDLDAWQSLYEKRNKFFTEHGISFLLVIVREQTPPTGARRQCSSFALLLQAAAAGLAVLAARAVAG